ncbi:Uncharacterised protein [Mycobacteroides abscessus]|nr:Uncharacterised protein [Mycobacteroides abscessus]
MHGPPVEPRDGEPDDAHQQVDDPDDERQVLVDAPRRAVGPRGVPWCGCGGHVGLPSQSLCRASLTAPFAFSSVEGFPVVPWKRSSGVVGGGIGTPAGGSAT